MAIASNHHQAGGFAFKAERRPVRHLMRGVWLQSMRRNEVFVVGILLGLFFVGALVLRIVGIDSGQTARFVAGLGLELGSMLSSALVIVMGARQIPVEIEQRTLYPVLAKPVGRGEVLLGKALPTWMLGFAAMAMFLAVTLAVAPHQPYQRFGVLAEALLCKAAALAMLTALVGLLSLSIPSSLAMLFSGLIAYLGSIPINWLATQPGMGAFASLVPDFKLFEQFSRFVDGGAPLGPALLAGLAAYAALWTAILGGGALLRFRRQPL